MTPVAQRLLDLHPRLPDAAGLTLSFDLRIRGPLSPDALEEALQDVVTAHPEMVPPGMSPPTLRRDRCAEHGLAERLALGRDTPLDLTSGEIGGLHLWQLAEDHHALQIRLHHACGDGWALELLARALSQAYARRLRGAAPAPPVPTSAPAAYAEGPAPSTGTLRAPQIDGAAPTGFARRRDIALPDPLCTGLMRGAKAMRCTLFAPFTAAVAQAVQRLLGGGAVSLGTLVANRPSRAAMDHIAPWYETGLMQIDAAQAGTFEALIEHVIAAQDPLMEAPAPSYAARSRVDPGLPKAPPVMVQFDRFPYAGLQLQGTEVTGLIANRALDDNGEVRVPHPSAAALTCFLRTAPSGLTLSIFRQEGVEPRLADALTADVLRGLAVMAGALSDAAAPLEAAALPRAAARPMIETNTAWCPIDLVSPAGDLSAWETMT